MEIKCTELGGELDIESIEEGEVKNDSLASALPNRIQGTQKSGSVERERIMSFGHTEFEVPL